MTTRDDTNIISFPPQEAGAWAIRIRVDLLLMPHPVWRRILMPRRATFWDLHVALQDVMGWRDRHLHRFTFDCTGYEERWRVGIPDPSAFHGAREVRPGWTVRLEPALVTAGLPALYTYGLAAAWQHEVNFEQILTEDGGVPLPHCLDGAGACPPEDCGGPEAYRHLVPAGAGDGFDPAAVVFDNPRLRWERAFGRS